MFRPAIILLLVVPLSASAQNYPRTDDLQGSERSRPSTNSADQGYSRSDSQWLRDRNVSTSEARAAEISCGQNCK